MIHRLIHRLSLYLPPEMAHWVAIHGTKLQGSIIRLQALVATRPSSG